MKDWGECYQMKINLERASGHAICRHDQCERKSEYINENGKIKKGTICAWLSIDTEHGKYDFCYCRNCIDKIYIETKKILNPNLWMFH